MHEVGFSKRRKAYHKLSLRTILNDSDLPFTQKERYVIGSIARYHRRALPKAKHYNLRWLNKRDQRRAKILSAILRVADALDSSRRSVVEELHMRSFKDRTVLQCIGAGEHDSEDQSGTKEKELFEKVFQKRLAVVWKPAQPIRESEGSRESASQNNP